MRLSPLMLALCLLPLVACQRETAPAATAPAATAHAIVQAPAAMVHDESSYAEPDKVVVKHLALDLAVDFDKKVLSGSATLDLDWKDPAAGALVLDTRDLSIAKVEGFDGQQWQDLKFELAPRDAIFGSKLSIATPSPFAKVRVSYRTSPEASGLQWLTPAMTQGGKLPFMFSQSEAIHARSWVPLQDTPGVRFTYEAHVVTAKDEMAVMSADNDPKAVRDGDYSFSMPQPIPSYLLAIAVGDLVFRPISERTGVWAEPAMADKAAKEFADTEKMVQAAESLYGAYRWGRYDLLVLPPSFPIGGMENPRLTFATPTVIVGDKSLVSLVAHELAHSWSGNLVTNSSWKDIWLNEGFTTYVQNRIVEALYGREASDMETVVDQKELDDTIKELAPADQLLALAPLTGRDPDDALSDVAYIKGCWFLRFLEDRYGRASFDPFLRSWFDQHAFQTADSAEFEAFLKAQLLAKNPGKVTEAEVHAWMHEPGIPAFAVRAQSARYAAVDTASADWLAGKLPAAKIDISTWGTWERIHFLAGLPDSLTSAQLAELDAAFHFTGTANGEYAMRWYPLTVQGGYGAARPEIAKFLKRVGRQKLITPIYRALVKTPDGLAFAKQVFAEARPGYHPITVGTVQKIIDGAGKAE